MANVIFNEDDFINYDEILSYNALINVVIGDRGVGKSYGAKKWCIKRFIKKGEKFLYVRRNKHDLDDISKFFDDLLDDKEINAHEFKVTGKKLYIDGLLCGEGVILSTAQRKKSVPYHEYQNLIFDEFLLEEGVVLYLPNEVSKFYSFLHTVIRSRSGCKVFVLGNAIKWSNPYFVFWKFDPSKEGIQVKQHGKVLLCRYINESFREKQQDTDIGLLIEGTTYGDMALTSTFSDLNDNFIRKKSKSAKLWYTILWQDKYYGLWFDNDCYIFSEKCNKQGIILCYSKSDFTPNMYLITDKKHPVNNAIKRAFKNSYLYYEDIYIRDSIYDLISLMGIR